MTFDTENNARLDAIARALESYLGIDPGALGRDKAVPTCLYRIERAVEALAAFLTTSFSPSGTTIAFSIQDPEGLKTHLGRGTKSFPAWYNGTGRTLTITRVRASSDADNYAFSLFKSASFTDLSTANDTLLGTITCADNGSQEFTAEITALTVSTIEAGKWLIWEHDSGAADVLTVNLEGILT
jgi:hypothetical protein